MSYCYSTDEERFCGDFETIDDALAAAFEEVDNEEGKVIADITVFVGEADKRPASGYISQRHIEGMLEAVAENAYEECGEVAEDWLQFPWPIYVMRSGKQQIVYHAREWPEEKIKEQDDKYKAYAVGLLDLTEKIKALVDEWATNNGHQPTFWGVNNVKQYYRNGKEV